MKKSFLLILLIFSQSIYSQEIDWAYNIGGHVEDKPIDLDKTSDGILLTTSTSLDSKGLHKYDSNGQLLWQFDLFESLPRGEYSNYNFLATEIDRNDHIYTLLNFNEKTIEINGITIHNGVSLLKIDEKGNLIWSEKISTMVSRTDISLLVKNDTIFVIGIYENEISINDDISFTSRLYWDCKSYIYRSGTDYYMAKFDQDGNLVDAVSFGEEYNDRLVSAVIDKDSNIYFTGGSDFHGGCSIRYTHITKYNSNFELIWKNEISKEENDSQLIYPSNIYYSQASEKLYLWAYNLGEIIHDNYNIPVSPCASRSDAVGAGANLVEFDSETGDFVKYRHYPNCTVNNVWGFGGSYEPVSINKAGIAESGDKLVILSSIHGSMEFDNGTFESTHLISIYDEFIWDENLFLMQVNKNDFSSDFITKFPGEKDNEYPESIDNPNRLIFASSEMYLSASFECNPIHIFGSSVSNNSGNNDSDTLIAKINLEKVLSNKDATPLLDFTIYPNPSQEFIFFESSTEEISSVKIYSVTGELIQHIKPNSRFEKLNISQLTSGLYFVEFKSIENHMTTKKIFINK